MSDPAKIRVVRCPKCENLLPELEGYSVYQCGGCGAVLRAENRNLEMDSLSRKSDEERVPVVAENLYSDPDNFSMPDKKNRSNEGSDFDVRSSGSSSSRRGEKINDNSTSGKSIAGDDFGRINNYSMPIHGEMGKQFEDLEPPNGIDPRYHRSESFTDWRRGIDRIDQDTDFQGLRYSTSVYQDVGPSNYHLRSGYGYGGHINNQNDPNELKKVEHLEQDRAELLRKLDELKYQISRSCNINDKPKERVLPDPRLARQELSHSNKSPYASHYSERLPYVQGLEDPLSPQILRRSSHQQPAPYLSRHYVHNQMDPYAQSYPMDMNPHHPHCSCFQCYNNHSRVPYEPYHPILHRNEDQNSFSRWDYNSKAMNPPLVSSHIAQSHPRWNNDHNRPRPRVMIATGKRRCQPIAGGAPLVLCDNCFQLLELPEKFSLAKKSYKKVKCGACSTIILFSIVDKKLVSASVDTNSTPDLVAKDSDLDPYVCANLASTNFSSGDYDNSGYDFHFMDREVCSPSEDQGFCSNNSENVRGFHSTSSYSSEIIVSPNSMNNTQAKTEFSPPQAGSPLQDHFDYSSKFRREKENHSGNSDREMELKKVASRQNSMKDVSFATEVEVSFDEDIVTGTSLESGEMSKDEDRLRVNKGGRSFFAGIIKKSFKDTSKSIDTLEQSSTNVMINGHSMTDRLLKKAEKVSGPVHPGEYWYDFRAGFWGVIGGPCLGILPPFIEEFNYPMPENCAGGNTNVFVNGRELHKKDLKLLRSRGLPPARDRSYIIEISGRVLDEDTGEELQSLGKLAPTVEKVKHGFGMKVPRSIAA